jgi:hypothetical protein
VKRFNGKSVELFLTLGLLHARHAYSILTLKNKTNFDDLFHRLV